jgi:starch phosphorylase
LTEEVLPTYYDAPDTWRQIVKNGMKDVRFKFDSNRMAQEYYDLLYNG